MEKMFRMADGTILTTSNEVVIEQYESYPEIYTPISEVAEVEDEAEAKLENEGK